MGNRQAGGGGDTDSGSDTGDDLEKDAVLAKVFRLLGAATEDVRVAPFQSDDTKALASL